jgi:hypothetical protein
MMEINIKPSPKFEIGQKVYKKCDGKKGIVLEYEIRVTDDFVSLLYYCYFEDYDYLSCSSLEISDNIITI